MALWLTGVVFLFCCEKGNGAANDVEFCPLAKLSSHCDKAAKADASNASVSDASHSIACCELLPAIFNKVRKLEQVQKHILPAPVAAIVTRLRPAAIGHTPVLPTAHAYIGGRQKLFIHNCVFRI